MRRNNIGVVDQLRVNVVSESEFSVQGHGVHTAFLEMRGALASRPDIDLLVNAKPSAAADITHLHTFGTFALKRLLARQGGKRVVSAHVVPDSLRGSLVGAGWWVPVFKYYLRWFYNRADLLLAVSDYTKQQLLALKVKAPIAVLENSIDTTRYASTPELKAAARASLGFSTDDFIVAGNGQVQPRKRFDSFIDVAKQMPDTRFVWIGGIPFGALGADYPHMTRLISHAPANVLVTGVIPLDDVCSYLAAADVFFNPSAQETFGLSIIEAAAAGLPVVVRDIHDYDATFGEHVLRGDDANFASLITSLRDPARRAEWSDQSLKLAAKYDSAAMTEKLVRLYRGLLPHGDGNQQTADQPDEHADHDL